MKRLAITLFGAGLVAMGLAGGVMAEDPCLYTLPSGGMTLETADAQARDLSQVVKDFNAEAQKKGGRVYSTPVGLFQAASELHNLGKYEEGASPTPQMRSGRETAFYNKIKEFVRNNPGKQLGLKDMLKMGLDVCADSRGNVDIQQVYLTVHNVTRILARPDQWVFDNQKHNKDPAVAPIFNDILGIKSSDGGAMFPDMMGITRAPRDGKTIKKGDIPDSHKQWTLSTLFSTEPGKGLFEPLPGAKDSLGSGGAYYYFWLGALAKERGGSVAVLTGIWVESRAKKEGGPCEYARGVMQLTHFCAGSKMADPNHPDATEPNTGSTSGTGMGTGTGTDTGTGTGTATGTGGALLPPASTGTGQGTGTGTGTGTWKGMDGY